MMRIRKDADVKIIVKLNLNLPWKSPATYRLSFGFANPNHAAAAICALFPFCRG